MRKRMRKDWMIFALAAILTAILVGGAVARTQTAPPASKPATTQMDKSRSLAGSPAAGNAAPAAGSFTPAGLPVELAAPPENPAPGQPLSMHTVAYQIDAQLNPSTHTIEGRETLVWKNLTGQPQQDLPFHLYLNAFQPTSTWITEARLQQSRCSSGSRRNYGSIEDHFH